MCQRMPSPTASLKSISALSSLDPRSRTYNMFAEIEHPYKSDEALR